MARRKSVRIMDADAIQTTLRRIAHEILENNTGDPPLAIVGIRSPRKRGDFQDPTSSCFSCLSVQLATFRSTPAVFFVVLSCIVTIC